MNSLFNTIGFNGPLLLFVVSLLLLRNKSTLLIIYVIGQFFSTIANYILKGFFQEPRPTENKKLFNMELANKYPYDLLDFERYGMPSGHAQNAIYSTIFIYLCFNNIIITLFYIIISLITAYQRVHTNSHTVTQIIIGSFVGSGFAYLFFNYGKTLLKRTIQAKPDDFGPA